MEEKEIRSITFSMDLTLSLGSLHERWQTTCLPWRFEAKPPSPNIDAVDEWVKENLGRLIC